MVALDAPRQDEATAGADGVVAEADGLRWLVGVVSAVVGTLMLVLPGQFDSPAFAVIRPQLHWWGVTFLLSGLFLLAVAILRLSPRTTVGAHLIAGFAWLAVAYGFFQTGGWIGLSSWGTLGLATALAPLASSLPIRRADGRGLRLISVAVGTAALLMGLSILWPTHTGGFAPSVHDPARAYLSYLGGALLLMGPFLIYAELRLRANDLAWRGAHGLLGAIFVVYSLLLLVQARSWTGFVLYSGVGLSLLLLPWLEEPVGRVDPTSLQTKLAFALTIAVSLPLVIAIAVLDDVLIAASGGAIVDSQLDAAREISFAMLLVFVALAVVVGIVIARWLISPLKSLARAIGAFATGNSSVALPRSGVFEVTSLLGEFELMREKRLQVEAERERLIAQLRQVEQSRAEFMRAISHDLRNPLTIIQATAQALPRFAEKPETLKRHLDSIVRATKRMDSMLSDLSDVARLDAGQVALDLVRVDLVAAVFELKGHLEVASQGDRIRTEQHGVVPPVLADANLVDRVLSNLLSNALKYSDPGTPITVSLFSREREAVVAVRDQGPGVPPEDLDRVFERYYRARATSEQHEGLGLGLYITKGLVEAMGGRIWVESEVGAGSTFAFTLPWA